MTTVQAHGARLGFLYVTRQPRINSYGNSLTDCNQVSDGGPRRRWRGRCRDQLDCGEPRPRALTRRCLGGFAAGGGPAGLGKSIASGLFGVLASAAVIWLDSHIHAGAYHLVVLSLLLGLLGALLCVGAALPLLSCIPASFIGASAFFAADSPLDGKLLSVLGSVVVGAFLGFMSQRLAGALAATTAGEPTAPRGAQQPAGLGRG